MTATEDTVEVELAELYIERDRLRSAEPPSAIRALRVREHLARVDKQIVRLEAMRA